MQSSTRWIVVLLGLSLALSASAAQDPNEHDHADHHGDIDAIKSRRAVMTLQSWYGRPPVSDGQGGSGIRRGGGQALRRQPGHDGERRGRCDVARGDRQRSPTPARPARFPSSGRRGRKWAGRPRRCRRPLRPSPRWQETGSTPCARRSVRSARHAGLPRRFPRRADVGTPPKRRRRPGSPGDRG